MITPLRLARRLPLLIVACALAAALAGCGNKAAHPHAGSEDGTASSGFYVDAGSPAITYQVQISRVLNPYDTEDKAYLRGVSPGELSLTASQDWFAIFIRAFNQSKVPVTTTDNFTVSDTQGNIYRPIALNLGANDIAYQAMVLRPNQTDPLADSPAYFDATQGSELLFKLNNSIYDNRPLTLNIYAKGQKGPSQVSLDL
jgi:hypothetical protein